MSSTEIEVADHRAALESFDPNKFNVLQPVVSIVAGNAASPYLAESVSLVSIDPDEDKGEVYTEFRYANKKDGNRALTSLGLKKIADAAGIRFLPTEVVDRERWVGRDGHRHARLHVRSAGAVRMLNGEWAVEFAEKEIDTEDWLEQARDAKERAAERNDKRLDPKKLEADLRRDLLAFREHLLSHAETRARSRVVRRLLSLPQVFNVKELARPFAVPRLVFRPDLAGAEEIGRIAMIGDVSLNGSEALATLYGRRGTGALPPLARELEPDAEIERPELSSSSAHGGSDEDESSDPAPAKKPARKRSRMGKARTTAKDPAAESGDTPPDPEPEQPTLEGLPDLNVTFGPWAAKKPLMSTLTKAQLLEISTDDEAPVKVKALAKAWADRRK